MVMEGKSPDNRSKTRRKAIPKKTRFEVFKRDSFACQYCGKKAPDVVLQIDHIKPVSKEGGSDILNLVTACKECNSGKSNRTLSDSSVLDKQRQQLEELQERREQLGMMITWQRELANLDRDIVGELCQFWTELVDPFSPTDIGRRRIEKLAKEFAVDEIMEAMRIAVNQYVKCEDGKPTQESVERAFNKIGGICMNRRVQQDKPYLKELLHIRSILSKRVDDIDNVEALGLLEVCHSLGEEIPILKYNVLNARSYWQWRRDISERIEELQGNKQ